MKYKFRDLSLIPAIMMLFAAAVSCSKDDNNDIETPGTGSTAAYVGSWRCDIDANDVIFIVIENNSKFTIYETDTDLLNRGMYEYKTTGTYTFDVQIGGIAMKTSDGEESYCILNESGSTPYLEIDGMRAHRVKSSEVPSISYSDYTPDDDDGDDDGTVRVTTGSCKHDVQLEATFECTVRGASEKAEVGFYLGFDAEFKPQTYRKITADDGYGKYFVTTNGIYGEQKYYYKAYVKDGGKEYFGQVRSFVSLPVKYSIDDRTFDVIRIDDGPYGPYCILQTELPANATLKFGEHTVTPMDMNLDGILTSYEFRQGLTAMTRSCGLPWRIPTIEEWQHAYNGGAKSKGYKYSGSNDIDEVAWYSGNSGDETHAIATKKPNELGLYDMCGNYSEPTAEEQIEYFYTHKYYLYAAINGYVTGEAYGGNSSSSASECTVGSHISTPMAKDMMDAGKIAIRFVCSIDPAFEPI